MKLKAKKDHTTYSGLKKKAGETYDVPDHEGQEHIKQGNAEPVQVQGTSTGRQSTLTGEAEEPQEKSESDPQSGSGTR